MCQNGTRKLSKLPSSPKNWHVISNTNLYTQPKHIPNMYIPTKMCQDGTRKPSKLHSSPKCLHDIFNTKLYTQLTYIPKLYIPTTMCQNGTGKPSKLPSSPKSWHYISTTKLYTQLTHIPKMYIPTTLCQNGTMKPSKLHSSPKCLHDIANTNIYLANWHIFQKCTFPQPCARRAQGNPPNYIHPPSVGMIYSILTYIFNCNIDMACYIQYKDIFQLTHNPKMFKCSKCSKMFHNFPCHNSHVIIFHVIISMSKWVPVQNFPSSNFFKFKWVPDEKIP